MSQATISSNQLSSGQTRQASSEMMKYYLASYPSTTTDRLAQGNIMSDRDLISSLEEKETQLDVLVRQAKGERPNPT
ncbi:hypothetical protein F4814DRAFT_445048 [Daldinia grandis]|nr:hypothetical protein F4814DRAFT_445048 [Daldinia grandis]